MQLRSQHCYLLDYVIVRQRDVKDVQQTRVIWGANYWTDHQMVLTRLLMTVRPPTRRRQTPVKSINIAVLADPERRQELQQVISEQVEETRELQLPPKTMHKEKWTPAGTGLVLVYIEAA